MADKVGTAPEAAKNAAPKGKFAIREIDFGPMPEEKIDHYARHLIRGFNPEEFTPTGKRARLVRYLRDKEFAHIKTVDELDKHIATQGTRKLKELPPEFQKLDRAKLIELKKRIPIRYNLDEMDETRLFKPIISVHKYATANKVTLDQIMQMPLRKTGGGGGASIPVIFPDAKGVLGAPNGIDEWTNDLFEFVKSKYPNATFRMGRTNSKNRPLAVLEINGRRIYSSLPGEFKLPDEATQ